MSRTITKSFEVGVSGKYQSYRFGSTETVEVSDNLKADAIEEIRNNLFNNLVLSTIDDIRTYADNNEDFQLVLLSRREELDKYKILLERSNKLSSQLDPNLFKG